MAEIKESKNRVEMNEEEYKKYSFDAMVYLDRICRKNNITYFLFYGTLIGAVRHNGFIPWDDDVDIIMPRKDYYKFIHCVTEDDSKYKVMSFHNIPDYYAPLAKLVDTSTLLIQNYGYKAEKGLGVYIDLFILDGLPQGIENAQRYQKEAIKLTRYWEITAKKVIHSRKTIFKDILRFFYYLPSHMAGARHYLNAIDIFASKYPYDNSEWVGNLSYTTQLGNIFHKEDLVPMDCEFEGYLFQIPTGYDRILTALYGDWRKLPPIEQQVSHHDYNCFKLKSDFC